MLPSDLDKSATWFSASIGCLFLGIACRITVDSVPLIVLLFGKSWLFVAWNVVACFLVGVLCGIREEKERRKR